MKQLFFLLLCNSILCQEIIYSENFDSMPFGSDFDPHWSVKNIEGQNSWRVSSHKNSKSKLYAKISGYKGSKIESDLLILKQDLTKCYNASIEFETSIGFFKHDGLTVWTHDSENFTQAKKIDPIRIAKQEDLDNYTFSPFISSNKIDISHYCGGPFYLYFHYLGNNDSKSTVYEIDNIQIWINE